MAARCTTGFFLSLSLDIDLPLLQHHQQNIFMFKKVNALVRFTGKCRSLFDPSLVPFWSIFGPPLVPLWSLLCSLLVFLWSLFAISLWSFVLILSFFFLFLSFFGTSLDLAIWSFFFYLQEISCCMKITKSILLDSIVHPSISLNKCERLDNLHLYKH